MGAVSSYGVCARNVAPEAEGGRGSTGTRPDMALVKGPGIALAGLDANDHGDA